MSSPDLPRKGRRLSALFGLKWKTPTDKDKVSSNIQEEQDEIKPLSKRVALSNENMHRLSLDQNSKEKSPKIQRRRSSATGKLFNFSATNGPISRRSKSGPMSTTTYGANSTSAPIEVSSGYSHGYLRVIPATSNNSIQDNINQINSRRFWFVFDDYTLRIFKDRTTSEEISQPIRLERCTVMLVDTDDLSLVILMKADMADAVVFDPYLAVTDSPPQANSKPLPSSSPNEDQNASSPIDEPNNAPGDLPHLFEVPSMTIQYGGMCKLVLQAESKEERDAWFFVIDRAQKAVLQTTSNIENGRSNLLPTLPSIEVSITSEKSTRSEPTPLVPRMLGDMKDSAVDREINRLSDVFVKRSNEYLSGNENLSENYKTMEPLSEQSKQSSLSMLDAAKQKKSVLIPEDSRKRLQQEMLVTGDPEQDVQNTQGRHRSKHTAKASLGSKELLLRYRIREDGSIDRYAVIGGTLKTLVEHLADENTPDNVYIDTFLLTFRHIAKPAEVMDLLISRYNLVPPTNATTDELTYYAKWAKVIQIRTVAVVKKWLHQYWSVDFEPSAEVREKLRIFLDVARDSSDEMITLVQRLEQLVVDQHNSTVTDLEHSNAAELKTKAQKKRETIRPRLEFYILDPVEFAHQLTLVDYDKFAAIQPVEFMMRLWEGNSIHTRHLSSIVEWFNQVSFFTATEICVQPELKKRAKLVENFIRVAEECCHHRNFNATMAVISGLNNSAVRRLKRTWALVQQRYLDILRDLENLMADDKNFHRYREAVNNVLTAAHPTPCIPFLGLLLRDLTFLNDGNPKTIKPTVFNFSKLRRIAHPILTQIIPFQRVPYKFPTTRLSVAVQNYLAVPNAMTDQNVTYSCSLLCEPRYSTEPAPMDGHAPVRLIEKWATENNHLKTEQEELAEVEKWAKNVSSFKRSTSVLNELASY